MALQSIVRQLVPLHLRQWCRVQYRYFNDRFQGHRRAMVVPLKPGQPRASEPTRLSVQQSLIPGPGLPPKLINIKLAIAQLEGVPVPSGGMLSFWELVGQPSANRGYQSGRNIINGQLSTGYGGGLCQLSSAMYELALKAGLIVKERHAHSTNVYTPQTTYTPLGLDATLSYGYKDLRLQNPWPYSFHFSFELGPDWLRVSLCAPEPMPSYAIRVQQQPQQHHENALCARVYRQEADGHERLLTEDHYRGR